MFKQKKKSTWEKLLEDFDIDHHYRNLAKYLYYEGYAIKCITLKKIDNKTKVKLDEGC